MDGTDLVRAYAAARAEKEAADGVQAAARERMEACEAAVLDWFAQNGVQRISLDGCTYYMSRQTWARATDAERLMVALDANGLGDLAQRKINPQTLSAWYRREVEDERPIPADIAAACAVSEKFILCARKG